MFNYAEEPAAPGACTACTATTPYGEQNLEIDVFKKTITSVGIGVAAATGAALLAGTPASAQTAPASAQVSVAHVLPLTATDRRVTQRWEHGVAYYLVHHPRHRHHVWYHGVNWHPADHHKTGDDHHRADGGDGHEAGGNHNTNVTKVSIRNSNTNIAVAGR